MEVPLTPLDFLRRARKLHGAPRGGRRRRRAADLRAVRRALRSLVGGAAGARRGQGDRVAYISPNTRSHLEGYYAVPQIGARHRADQLPADRRRLRLPDHAQRLEGRLRASGSDAGGRSGPRSAARRHRSSSRSKARATAGSTTSSSWRRRAADARSARDRRARSARHQLHERDDVAAEGRDDHASQRLHERGRHAASICRCSVGDRYLWTLPMFHANGWTSPGS